MSEQSDSFEVGWKQPDQPGTWREPDREEVTGWRLHAIPRDIPNEPEEPGAWHTPDSTTYTDDDTVDVAVRPEDELLALMPPDAQQIDADEIEPARPEDALPRPEDATAPEDTPLQEPDSEAMMAPEDLLYMLEHIDEQEEEADDFNTASWSELVALASLAEESEAPGVERGEESPISAELALRSGDEDDSEDVDIQMLSPAERMALGEPTGDTELVEGEVVDEGDPGDYARRQLEQLAQQQGGTTPPTEPVAEDDDPAAYARQQLASLMGDQADEDTGVGSATQATDASADDPAAYARQQLASLVGDEGSPGAEAAPEAPAPPAEELSPREQELLRRFRETEQQVRQLRQQYQSGQLSQQDFVQQLRDQMILDDDQVWWMMGVETDTWYKSENNQWVEATPEIFEKAQRVQGQQGADDYTEYGSIPYLDTQGQQPAEEQSEQSLGGLDDEYMPLPRQVPVDDMEATVPSKSVFEMNTQEAGAATVPSAAYSQPTQMAQPVDYGRIEAPIDEDEVPPDYDLDEEDEGEVYREARDRQRRTASRTAGLVAALAIGLVLIFGAGYAGLATVWYNSLTDEWQPAVAVLASEEASPFQTVTIYDINGNRIATLGNEGEDRRPVEIGQISPFVIHALLSRIDPNFYQSGGWGVTDTLTAFGTDLTGGTIESNISPITVQVAEELILQDEIFTSETERAKALTAVGNLMLEEYTHAEILQFYLNEVAYFGNEAYGIEAAAQFYFEKPAAQLNLPESALLVGIIESPGTLEPIRNRQAAEDRMYETLDLMAEAGCINFDAPLPAGGESQTCVSQTLIDSPQTTNQIGRLFIELRDEERSFVTDYPYFVDLVRIRLENEYGSEMYRRGYEVTTTLDISIQDAAQTALRTQVQRLQVNNVNTGAVMVTDPQTGAVLAMVGGVDYTNEDINGSTNQVLVPQEPAEAILPVVYTMGLVGFDDEGNGLQPDEYATAATLLWDVPITLNDGTPITPVTGVHNGPVRVRPALASALNIPAYKVYNDYGGASNFREVGTRMSLRFPADATFPETTPFGTVPVGLYDMMEAYGTIANDGTLRTLYIIDNITDTNGNPVPIAPSLQSQTTESVIPPGIAFILQDILGDDAARGLRFAANSQLVIPGIDAAAISGTSPGGRDLWTMGFTSNRVVGVWLGHHADQETFNNLTGFTSAAPVWNAVMGVAIEGTNVPQFQPAPTIRSREICALTGNVYETGDPCPQVINEFFVDGRFPSTGDGFTVTLNVDSWTGLIANEFCSSSIITETFVAIEDPTAINWINTDPRGRQWAQQVGVALPAVPPPTQACTRDTPRPAASISSPQGGQTVIGTVQINGQVGDTQFDRYEVQVAPAGTEQFDIISTSTTPVINQGTLATWDTTNVPNGAYTIRLVVFADNPNNGFVRISVDVTVNNPDPTPTPPPTAFPTNTPAPLIPTSPPVDPLPFDDLSPTPAEAPTLDPLGP